MLADENSAVYLFATQDDIPFLFAEDTGVCHLNDNRRHAAVGKADHATVLYRFGEARFDDTAAASNVSQRSPLKVFR